MTLALFPREGQRRTPVRRDLLSFEPENLDVANLLSIPMHAETLRLHAKLVAEYSRRHNSTVLVDVLDTTGAFFKTLADELNFNLKDGPETIRCVYAGHTSKLVADYYAEALPFVQVCPMHTWKVADELSEHEIPTADFVCLHHVLPFVQKSFKEIAVRQTARILRPGGMMLTAQREAVSMPEIKIVQEVLTQAHEEFLSDNGYEDEHITKKEKALLSRMWPSSGQVFRNLLYRSGFGTIVETTRWGSYSSHIAVKQR